jgi:hypothetical protein
MANALTNASQITCPHSGKITPASSAKLTIAGQPVLLSQEWSGWAIACPAPTSQSTKTCTKVVAVTGAEATKLSVGGVAVLLDSGTGSTDGNPPTPVSMSAGETKVQAV